MKRLLTTLVIAATALAGCASDPDSGVVIDKSHKPAWEQVIIINRFPHRIPHPECWRLDLDTGKVCVERRTWEAVEIGDTWKRGD